MARPLKKSTIEKMDLTVKTFDGESKKLGKQVGYNKYIVDEETHEIVMLVTELKEKGDALLILEDHGKDKPVIKIVEHLFQTPEKPYAYVRDAEGKVVFLDEGVSVYGTKPDVKNAEEAIEEINNIPEGGEGGADIEGDATFSSIDHLTIGGDRNISVSVNGVLTAGTNSISVAEPSDSEHQNNLSIEAETVDLAQNAMIIKGTATLTINGDGSSENNGGVFGTDALMTSGDEASTTIQGGK